MSHDRGCHCGREPYDYDLCTREDCTKLDHAQSCRECGATLGTHHGRWCPTAKKAIKEQSMSHYDRDGSALAYQEEANKQAKGDTKKPVPFVPEPLTRFSGVNSAVDLCEPQMLPNPSIKSHIEINGPSDTCSVTLSNEQIQQALGVVCPDLGEDSGDRYLDQLETIAAEDAAGLRKAQASYGNSWKIRGGVGAFMMLARKWDRLEIRLRRIAGTLNRSRKSRPNVDFGAYDIFGHIALDTRAEGVIDDIRDLRRYLMLVEAEMRARGFQAAHRDNQPSA